MVQRKQHGCCGTHAIPGQSDVCRCLVEASHAGLTVESCCEVLSTLELNVFGRTLADRATWTAVQVRDRSCCAPLAAELCRQLRSRVPGLSHVESPDSSQHSVALTVARVAWLPCRRPPSMMQSRNPT